MYEFYGKHILAEFMLISQMLINDINALVSNTKNLITQSGATLVDVQVYTFSPNGYTIFFVLKESHVSIHSYPEQGAIFLDVFTCGHRIEPLIIANGLCNYLCPQRKKIQLIERCSL